MDSMDKMDSQATPVTMVAREYQVLMDNQEIQEETVSQVNKALQESQDCQVKMVMMDYQDNLVLKEQEVMMGK